MALCGNETFHEGLILFKVLIIAFWHGSTDDERCTRIVNEHGVDLVHDGVVVAALHKVLGRECHVVAQIVEAKLVVCSEGYVSIVGLSARIGIWLVFVNAINA